MRLSGPVRRRLTLGLLLAPALAVTGFLFFGALGTGLVRSLGHMPSIGLTGPTLDAYRAVLGSDDFLAALVVSLHIAVTSTALALGLGIALAFAVRRFAASRPAVRLLIQANLAVPHVVGALAILLLFSQSGSLARLSAAVGLIDRPAAFPALVFDPHAVGIILHYVWKEVPFVALVVLANLQALGEDHAAAARSLGASRLQAVRHVLLPQVLPGALGAAAVVFAFSFGTYEVPLLLGQTYPPALPVLAWRAYAAPDLTARPAAMALALVIAAVAAVGVVGLGIAARRLRP